MALHCLIELEKRFEWIGLFVEFGKCGRMKDAVLMKSLFQ